MACAQDEEKPGASALASGAKIDGGSAMKGTSSGLSGSAVSATAAAAATSHKDGYSNDASYRYASHATAVSVISCKGENK